jgi:4-hydroxy-tetrahydrodipicolinate synthase
MMTLEERREAIRVAQAAVPPEKNLIVHVGAMSTLQAVELAKAASSGPRPADLLMAIPPYYHSGALSHGRFRDHFHAIAESTDLPLIYYHIPKMSHFAPTLDLLSETIEKAPLYGMKDSDGDLNFMRLVRGRHPQGRFLYLTGNLTIAIACWEEKGDGAILGAAAGMPAQAAELHRAWRDENFRVINDLYPRLQRVWDVVKIEGNTGIRELARHFAPSDFPETAFHCGRRPFATLPEGARERIAKAVKDNGFA